MGRPKTSPKRDPYARRSGGGVLSAAQKRRRMLDAGKRFLIKSLEHLSPARCASKAGLKKASRPNLACGPENLATSHLANSHLKGGNKKLSSRDPVPVLIPAIKMIPASPSIDEQVSLQVSAEKPVPLPRSGILKKVDSPTTSHTVGTMDNNYMTPRPNRPSFFPNGINPFEQATLSLSAKKQHTRSYSESDRVTPGKSVRFADSIMENWASPSRRLHTILVKEWSRLLEKVDDVELKEVLSGLPKESLERLISVVAKIKSEACNCEKQQRCDTGNKGDKSSEAVESSVGSSQMGMITLTPNRYSDSRPKLIYLRNKVN